MSSPVRPDNRVTIRVIGIGADGWAGLPETSRAIIEAAPVLLGGRRHLDLVPPVDGQLREPYPTPLRDGLRKLVERSEEVVERMEKVVEQRAKRAVSRDHRGIVALASGDPLVSGIAATLIDIFGPDAVEVIPAVSSVSLARARMRWPAETSTVLTLVGRDESLLLRELSPGRRILVLSSDESTPARVAALLTEQGYGDSRLVVLGDLGAADETRIEGRAHDWSADSPRLHVLALQLADGAGNSWATGLPDDAFEHDGQLTKRDLRASALARLAPQPEQLLWDIGGGAGSVGIEWMRSHPTCRTIAIESNPERAARIARNAASLGVPGLEVVEGRAPDALRDLPVPDAIFVGGGATSDGLLDLCLEVLGPGGRLVVHGVTLETEAVLARRYAEHGGELTRISVETAAPVGTFTGWTPARAVTQWFRGSSPGLLAPQPPSVSASQPPALPEESS